MLITWIISKLGKIDIFVCTRVYFALNFLQQINSFLCKKMSFFFWNSVIFIRKCDIFDKKFIVFSLKTVITALKSIMLCSKNGVFTLHCKNGRFYSKIGYFCFEHRKIISGVTMSPMPLCQQHHFEVEMVLEHLILLWF